MIHKNHIENMETEEETLDRCYRLLSDIGEDSSMYDLLESMIARLRELERMIIDDRRSGRG